MAIEERLPPACAFAISVLQERETDPEGVPEEAVEAAQQHLATCIRCLSSPPMIAAPRKKRRRRPVVEEGISTAVADQSVKSGELAPSPTEIPGKTRTLAETADRSPMQSLPVAPVPPVPVSQSVEQRVSDTRPTGQNLPAPLQGLDGQIDCAQCRQLLPDYAEALDSGRNAEELYPEVHDHLLMCDTGCLVLLDLFRQEARANRKYRRRPVRDPFSAIGWELSGFFRTGQVTMGPMALAYGTLMLMLVVASLSAILAINWDNARYYHPAPHTIPTPDGIGLSDGLHIYDACNASGYADKRAAAQALRQHDFKKADSLFSRATSVASADTSGCNGAEAAIYREDLLVRQAGHPFGVLVVSFDSGPGIADPTGGTDRHILYAAYTQELVGAYIAQHQYNSTQMDTPGAPLLYLVLANTAGEEQGALRVASLISSMAGTSDLSQYGLLAGTSAPLLGVLGLAPSSLLQVALPMLCRAGVPVISPTATGLFIVDQLKNTSMYQHCAPGFAFVRFSADDAGQSAAAANYAYNRLHARNVATFYDPSNPSSQSSAQYFISTFTHRPQTRIVAQETAVSNGLLDGNGKPEASSTVLLDGLTDALRAKPHPDLIYAPMLTNDVITLAQALARLPADQQPALMIGGEFVHPAALQALTQWVRQQQLTMPRIYISLISAARPPVGTWQKQFYASFCQSFATPGSFCSGTAALDQGALLFADGVEMVSLALAPVAAGNTTPGKGGATPTPSTPSTPVTSTALPTPAQLLVKLSRENFPGVSCQINMRLWDKVLITSTSVSPVVLGVQPDGSLQIVG